MPTADPDQSREYVAASYRYLRLAMVILVFVLAVSIVIERLTASCFENSISAYYYTPVHSIFVGSLVTIGVALVALKGRDGVEDLCFNLAGVLAFVVALVPTSPPTTLCSREVGGLAIESEPLINNNVPALLIGTVAALALAYVIAHRQGKVSGISMPTPSRVGFGISVIFLAVGIVWYFGWRDNFVDYAHGSTAVAMFVAIWAAVMVNTGWPRPVLAFVYRVLGVSNGASTPSDQHLRYRPYYRCLSIFMVAAVAVVFVAGDRKVFWLEALEILPFAVFWVLQTLESWTTGVAEPVMSAQPDVASRRKAR